MGPNETATRKAMFRTACSGALRFSALGLSVAALVLLAGCSTTDGAQGTTNGRAQKPPTATLTPDAPSSLAPDAPGASPAPTTDVPDAGPPPTRARCGAAPYDWLPATHMGDILETRSAASHSPIELDLVALQFKQKGAFKTRRGSSHGTNAKLIRYQTQDRGQLTEATALVTTPITQGPDTFPVMLFLHGTIGFNDLCSPTRPIVESNDGGFSEPTAVIASILASYGYIAVFPDYLGLKSFGPPSGQLHPYLVGEPTAIASLDAVRAALKFVKSDTDLTPGPLVVVGASQGGHAAAFVDRYAPHYAPELPIAGEAWIIPPTDLEGQVKVALGGSSPTKAWANVAGFLVGAEEWYRAAPQGLASAFQAPFDTALLTALMSSCSSVPGFDSATPATVFTSALLTAAQASAPITNPFGCYARESSLESTSVPRASDVPAMVVLGEKDGLVSTPVERAAFQTLCSQGYRLKYQECAGQDHTESFFRSWDDWLDFLGERAAGEPLTGTCVLNAPVTCGSTP